MAFDELPTMTSKSRKQRNILLACGAALALLLGAATAFFATRPSTAAAEPPPIPKPTTPTDEQRAKDTVMRFFELHDAALADPAKAVGGDGSIAGFESVVASEVLTEAGAIFRELSKRGQEVEGHFQNEVMDITGGKKRRQVIVCRDLSQTRTIDRESRAVVYSDPISLPKIEVTVAVDLTRAGGPRITGYNDSPGGTEVPC